MQRLAQFPACILRPSPACDGLICIPRVFEVYQSIPRDSNTRRDSLVAGRLFARPLLRPSGAGVKVSMFALCIFFLSFFAK